MRTLPESLILLCLLSTIGCGDGERITGQHHAVPAFGVEAGSGVAAGSGTASGGAPLPHKYDDEVLDHQIPVSISGKVVGISDGDTIDILTDDKRKIRIRLNAIDAPESGQPYGKNSKQFLSECIGGKVVEVITHGNDQYKRIIGDVFVGGSLVNLEIVKAGLAWHYVKYAPDNKAIADAELEARAARSGLWSDSRFVAPWDWRKLSKAERDKLR